MNIGNNEELGKSQNNTENNERYIDVPRGWNRRLENNSIVYFSPSQICLRSKEEIAGYLISDRTCKCGLDCPLYIDKVFNFDASIPSHHFKITKNDHKTLCKETIKARFATLAQTQTVNKKEIKEGGSKPVIVKKKSEVTVSKKKNETPRLPSFDTFVSLPEEKLGQNLQEQAKPKKPRKPVSHKRKSNLNIPVTSAVAISVSTADMRSCQTVHSNSTPILHSSVEIQRSSRDVAIPQYPAVSKDTVFGTSEHHVHPLHQNTGPLFTLPSSHLNASTFLASLSSTPPGIPGQIPSSCTGEVNQAQRVHPLHPFTAKSLAEHAAFAQKPVTTAFPAASNQPNNLVYLSSGLHPIPNQNPNTNWQGTAGIPIPRLPQGKGSADKTYLEKSKGGFTLKVKESLPKTVYPYPTPVPTAKSTMSFSSTTPVTSVSKVQLKQQDLQQVVQNATIVNTTLAGRSELVLPTSGYSSTIISSPDKNNTRTATVGQYCGILLQPGMLPHVQLAGAAPRPTTSAVSAGNSQTDQYSNLFAVQGIPYGSNVGAVGNSALLGLTPNTLIPYFLGITQPGTTPKPVVPTTTSTSTTKESSPTCTASTAPVSTSAIAAAYRAFVSIAPASVTNCSFSQQLVNLVSNYNNPYWQHLLTQQGTSTNTLAYQLMQINQCAGTPQSLPTQATKSSSVKNAVSSYGQTKVAISSSKSTGSSSQERKPKSAVQDSLSAPATSISVTSTAVTTVSEGDEGKMTSCATSSSLSIANENTCTSSKTVASPKDSSTEHHDSKSVDIVTQTSSEKNSKDITNSVDDTAPSLQMTKDTPSQEIASQEITSQENTSQENTSQEYTCQENTSQEITSQENTSQENTSQENTSQENTCQENTSQNITSKEITSQEITSQEITSQEITSQEITSREIVSNLKTVKDNKSSVKKHEVDSHALRGENSMTSERSSTILKCENVNTENVKNESTDVTTNSKSDEEMPVNNDCSNFDEGNDNVVSEETNSCVVKTDAVEDAVDCPMETDDLSSSLSNNQECDQDFKVKDNKEPVDSVIQNGVTEKMLNDTEVTGEVVNNEKETSECVGPVEFTIGDVVWAQARGLPSWPGKIVDERDVGSGKADIGKKWVMWFGDHTHSQVEVEKLKTLTDGLKTLDDKGRKRKYRGKKTRIGLEQAIGEALEELDQPLKFREFHPPTTNNVVRERLRSRQGPKAKKRRL